MLQYVLRSHHADSGSLGGFAKKKNACVRIESESKRAENSGQKKGNSLANYETLHHQPLAPVQCKIQQSRHIKRQHVELPSPAQMSANPAHISSKFIKLYPRPKHKMARKA